MASSAYTTRRALLGGAAALPLAGLAITPALAAPADPVIALVEHARRAWDDNEKLETPDREIEDASHNAVQAAFSAVFACRPTTVAGLVAMLDLFWNSEVTDPRGRKISNVLDGENVDFLRSIIASARALA